MKHHTKTMQELDTEKHCQNACDWPNCTLPRCVVKSISKSITEAKEIRARQDRRERALIDNTTAIKELVIELNKEYGINTSNS